MLAIRTPRLFDADASPTTASSSWRTGASSLSPRGRGAASGAAARVAARHAARPGFIDVQVNGGGGVLLNEEPSPAGAAAIIAAHRRHGTTGCLPTLITDRPEVPPRAPRRRRGHRAPPRRARPPRRGPFINPARKGVHREDYIRVPTQADAQPCHAGAGRALAGDARARAHAARLRPRTGGRRRAVSIGHSERRPRRRAGRR